MRAKLRHCKSRHLRDNAVFQIYAPGAEAGNYWELPSWKFGEKLFPAPLKVTTRSQWEGILPRFRQLSARHWSNTRQCRVSVEHHDPVRLVACVQLYYRASSNAQVSCPAMPSATTPCCLIVSGLTATSVPGPNAPSTATSKPSFRRMSTEVAPLPLPSNRGGARSVLVPEE